MKRTRRIEITRYRRKVTVSQDKTRAAEISEDGRADALILEVLQSTPLMPDVIATNAVIPEDVESECSPTRGSRWRLGQLLRMGKRT